MRIAYRGKANMDEVIRIIWSAKQRKIIQDEGIVCYKITYYKLRVGEQFAHYIIDQSIESYRVGGAKEFLNQTLMIPGGHCIRETMRKKLKIVARAGLCSGQRCGSAMANTMEGNLPDVVWNVMQTDYQSGAPGINKSHRVIYGWSKAFQLSS